MATIYLYCRVSTNKQLTEGQEYDLIKRFPEGVVVKETASGVKRRPALEKLLETAQKGDTIAVVALDRLGRKLTEILTNIETLYRRGINVVSLREGVDYSTPTGRLVTQVLMAVAELERELIGQRTSATLQAMKARGAKVGRPNKYSAEVIERARALRAAGLSYQKVSAEIGVSVGRVFQLLNPENPA